jgi:hypothetical protein
MALAHSVDEALDRFELIQGTGSLDENRGCAMTVLSWMAGESWTDSLPCTNTVLRANVIAANDANNATSTHRAEMVRAGVDGILDTWWVPDQVVAWGLVDKDTPYVDRVIAAVKKIAAWKVTHDRPNLGGANLGGANLGGANLRDANLRDANLRDANLRGANLRGANLRDANLGGANLRGANLGGANLGGANLGGANLGGANLGGANLGGANLGGADANEWTTWPVGFAVPEEVHNG